MIFQAMGITYILGGAILMPQFVRDAVDLVAGPTTFFVGATLAFVAALALAAVLRQRTGRLGGRERVPALFRSEHDRLRLSRHRHQARQRADRRPLDPGRLFRLVRAPPGGDQRLPHRAGPADARTSRAREDLDLARPGLHRADLHGRPDDRAGRLGNRPAGAARAAGELDRRPQSLEGAVVLPGPSGNAGLLRPLDRGGAACRA